MTRIEALLVALDTQAAAAQAIAADALLLPSPCDGWSVADVMRHSLGVTMKFSAFAAAETDAPSAPVGDLLGADHGAAFGAAAAFARRAWSGVDLTRTCRLPFGTFSAEGAASINLFDVLAHSWDVAAATGATLECDDELWLAGLAAAREVVGPARDERHYGAELSATAGASPRALLLAYLGRRDGFAPRRSSD